MNVKLYTLNVLKISVNSENWEELNFGIPADSHHRRYSQWKVRQWRSYKGLTWYVFDHFSPEKSVFEKLFDIVSDRTVVSVIRSYRFSIDMLSGAM